MSPFAHFLKVLRQTRGLRQRDLAEMLGYEQSYLSALESGAKGPPRKDFLGRLARKLELTDLETSQLQVAVEHSRRCIKLPSRASTVVYELCHALEQQLDHLEPVQIELIDIALRLPAQGRGTSCEARSPSSEIRSAACLREGRAM